MRVLNEGSASVSWRKFVGIPVLILSAGCAALLLSPLGSFGQPKKQLQDDVFPQRLDTLDPVKGKQKIPGGKKEDAEKYYKKMEGKLFPKEKMPVDLDALLDYSGYPAIRAIDLEELVPEVLMDARKLKPELEKRWKDRAKKVLPTPNEFTVRGQNWDLLAARYFSPKTSDVSRLPRKLSWRKVVRLKAQPPSAAKKTGLDSLYFLSVIYPKDLAGNPFATRSINVQVMLIRDKEKWTGKEDPAYWLVFDPAANYRLAYSTATSWDAADPALLANAGIKDYFVPTACKNCHGGRETNAIPQFFDTDYMLDRTSPGDDFENTLGRSKWGALFDGGRNPYTLAFRTAVDVFRRLNKEILDQNEAINQKSISAAAARNWWQLHKTSDLHLPPIKRGLTAKDIWRESNDIDFQLLPLLTRFCYRCHSTFRFNVFNKAEVLERAEEMVERLESHETGYRMPEDRLLGDADRNLLVKLLKNLKGK